MNERIQQLAEQADMKLWFIGDGLSSNAIIGDKNIEKFAELIVKECANQVDWILAEGGKTQGDLIKQHFGVEE